MSEPQPNKIPSIWQIVDTYGIRVLQNNGAKPTRLIVSLSLAKRLAREIDRDFPYKFGHNQRIVVKLGQCTDFMGMGTRIVPDDEIRDGEFDIDYVPCEHRPYQEREKASSYSDPRRNAHFGFDFRNAFCGNKFAEEWAEFADLFGRWGI